ncbi:MAG: hypothetical protein J6V07_02865 [Clostridia bacterium]|nr:hypothetical protein [Clostridia bacterium]
MLTCRDVLTGNAPERVLFYAYSDLDRHGYDRAIDDELFQSFRVVAGLATLTVRIRVPMGAIVPCGFRERVTDGTPGSPTTEETERLIAVLLDRMED